MLPKNRTNIKAFEFFGCKELKTVIFPSSLQSIGAQAFQNCQNLNTVSIPASVNSIGSQAFQDCPSLASATYFYGTMIGIDAFYLSGYPRGTRVTIFG